MVSVFFSMSMRCVVKPAVFWFQTCEMVWELLCRGGSSCMASGEPSMRIMQPGGGGCVLRFAFVCESLEQGSLTPTPDITALYLRQW